MSLERPDRFGVEVLTERTTVVTALPLKRAPRDRLTELLDARVVDVRDPIDHVDLVLTPACSPQLIAALKRKYDGARVIVVELDDWDFDVSVHGPVKRILRSGADAYVLADSIEELARKITPVWRTDERRQCFGGRQRAAIDNDSGRAHCGILARVGRVLDTSARR